MQHLKLEGDLFTKESKPSEGRRTNSLQVVNDTDTTVNVIDPQTNQTVATVPGKIVKVAFTPEGGPPAVTLSSVALLALNGSTGYVIFYPNELFAAESDQLPKTCATDI